MEFVIIWIVLCMCVGAFAVTKGHSGVGMFLLSLLLSPLIGFIIELIRNPYRPAVEAAAINAGDMKKCPACAEMIKAEAVKCRYCGEDVSASGRGMSAEEKRGW